MINYGKQTIDEEDIKAVIEVLKSDFLTSGPKVKEFEEKFAKYVGAKYGVAVSNGTAALHLSCLAAGLQENEELITSPMTFAASANCALYCRAKPVFVDIDEKTGLIDENKIEEKITNKTKIILPVHYAGFPCNLKKIKEIADKYNLFVIEDACHALGAKYYNSKIGDCAYSDMSVFSFHPVKHITTGEGGMITTNSEVFYKKLLSLRNHGFVSSENLINKTEGPWHREIHDLGFNYRITDFQCALGISQLKKIDEFVKKRKEIAKKYYEALSNNEEIEIIKEDKNNLNSYHLYVIKVKDSKTRLDLFNYLKQNNVFCQIHYIPVNHNPYYKKKFSYKKGNFSETEKFYERIISLPIYPDLKEEQNKVIELICDFFK
jgi:UDP-4-amino-4,6-dideoxy-N-acetyl-beta-L-altrosamine transaminase